MDLDECIHGNHDCQDPFECINNLGSYDCRCKGGMKLAGLGSGINRSFDYLLFMSYMTHYV